MVRSQQTMRTAQRDTRKPRAPRTVLLWSGPQYSTGCACERLQRRGREHHRYLPSHAGVLHERTRAEM